MEYHPSILMKDEEIKTLTMWYEQIDVEALILIFRAKGMAHQARHRISEPHIWWDKQRGGCQMSHWCPAPSSRLGKRLIRLNADWPTNAKWWIRSPFRVPEPSFTNGWAGIIKAAKQIRESVQTAQTFRPNLLHQKSEPMHERVKWFQRSLQDWGKTETLGQGHRLGLNVPRFVHVSRQGLDKVPEAYAVYALRISTNAIWAVQSLKLKVRQISDW
jgi:hypothetical protein